MTITILFLILNQVFDVYVFFIKIYIFSLYFYLKVKIS